MAMGEPLCKMVAIRALLRESSPCSYTGMRKRFTDSGAWERFHMAMAGLHFLFVFLITQEH